MDKNKRRGRRIPGAILSDAGGGQADAGGKGEPDPGGV